MAELVEARKVLRLVQAIFYDEGQLETAGPSGGKSVDILLEALRTARQEFEDMIIEDGPEPNWKHGHRAARRCELAVALYEYRTAFGWSAEETDNEAS
jgi:hypothetical protein